MVFNTSRRIRPIYALQTGLDKRGYLPADQHAPTRQAVCTDLLRTVSDTSQLLLSALRTDRQDYRLTALQNSANHPWTNHFCH